MTRFQVLAPVLMNTSVSLEDDAVLTGKGGWLPVCTGLHHRTFE